MSVLVLPFLTYQYLVLLGYLSQQDHKTSSFFSNLKFQNFTSKYVSEKVFLGFLSVREVFIIVFSEGTSIKYA